MKTILDNTSNKVTYIVPQIVHIKLDNEISLQLESEPPVFPGEGLGKVAPEYFNNDPFKTNVG
ncbi:MAG: hypothetical protein PHR83_19205 [Paludibacter sp.]|nr:hypothetical protein [Paludibacter sp.]